MGLKLFYQEVSDALVKIGLPIVPVTLATLGIPNVNNTSDVNKPVSTAQATADTAVFNAAVAAAAASLSSAIGSLTRSSVGLGNVDNTSDVNKPVSTAQQTALDLKVTANGAITGATKTKITYDAKGLVTGGADATTADVADSADKRYCTDAQKTVIGNTSGTNTGDQTNISGNSATTTLAADSTKVANTTPSAAGKSMLSAADAAAQKVLLSLGNVDNTTDAGKPVSTAQQTALNLKADLAGPTFTGTPAAPTAAAGTNTTQLATTAFVAAVNNNASYSTLLAVASSHTAAKVAGTYALGYGDVAAVGGTGTLYPLASIYLAAADYPTVGALTTKLRLRIQLHCNDVAPFTGTFTFGLFPITRPGTSGGAGLCIFTIGTVVAGSNGAVFTNPAADSSATAVGSDFALPADGHYVIAMVTSQTMATSSHVHAHAELQIRNT